ncbi:MAG TPA: sigma 54-interacting transcriptional regulator [Kofleriaceae bacterium]|nr:sigma 54-interacting transcriptional regulator [Kofleriaceae bacterium]
MSEAGTTTRGESLASTVSGPASWVLVAVGAGELKAYALAPGNQVVLGRDAGCDIVLDHDRVSRRHARVAITQGGDACTVEDLASRNGTRVGNTTIDPEHPHVLRAGDAIGVGPFTLILAREPASQRPSSLVIEDPLAATPSPVLESVARSGASVLIRGETGTGKQVLAETIHRLSGRPGRLVSINCAAIGHELLESELFGHERGAFTGAVATKPGLLEVAGGGTVLLDEIGDMPSALQAKLLRAVESREVMRVGGTEPVKIQARFVSATHRDLLAAVEEGKFRLDLFYRLAAVTLTIPPLRERGGRIVWMARELLAAAAARDKRPVPSLSAAAAARLQAHDWPGNVRELRNVLDRALILADDSIEASHITFDEPPPPSASGPVAAFTPSASRPPADVALRPEEEAERQRILDALEQCSGNQTRAAKLLGISRSTLATKLSIYRIPRPRKP